MEVMQPPAEPNQPEDGDVSLLVLVQMQVQVEAQPMTVLLAGEAVKQHTAVLNLQANVCKQEQGEAQRWEEV